MWMSLVLIVASFIAFILFLDQNIVKNSQHKKTAEVTEGNSDKPIFDFYTVLPQREVEIPDVPVQLTKKNAHSVTNKKIAADARYILQVGSYQALSDADRQKAQLAFLGLEARISSAKVNGDTYYRVEMGPYDSSQYSSVQKSLIENDVDFLPKKVR